MASRSFPLSALLLLTIVGACIAANRNPGCKHPKAGDPDFEKEIDCQGVIKRINPKTHVEEKCRCQCAKLKRASGYYCPLYGKRNNGKKTTKKTQKTTRKHTTKKPKTTTPDDEETTTDDDDDDESTTTEDDDDDDTTKESTEEEETTEAFLADSNPALSNGFLHRIFFKPMNYVANYFGRT